MTAGAAGLCAVQHAALQAWLARATASMPASPVRAETAADPNRLVDALVAVVLARPWRRSAADARTQADVRRKLQAAVAAQTPIELAVPFGGYKGWRVRGAPHLNWAEVMWLDYLRSYASRLADLYPPGVRVSLSYLRGVLQWLNHLPLAQQEVYLSELHVLVTAMSTPSVQFALVDLAASVDDLPALLAQWSDATRAMPLPSASQLASAARNLVGWRPASAVVSDSDWPAEVHEAARRCAVMEAWPPRRAFNKLGPRIQLTHVRGASLSVHIGSCRSGVAQPWVATGALQWQAHTQTWLERLLTTETMPALEHRAVAHPLADALPGLRTLPLVLEGL